MAQVDITVNGRPYRVTCENGQEERLKTLAAYLDRHVAELADSVGQIGEARLMLLAGLTVCDELFELREARVADADAVAPGALDEANAALEDATSRLTALAKGL